VSPLDGSVAPLPAGAPDADGGRIDALRRMAPGAGRRAAAQELQVMFLTQLIQAMRRTVPENDFLPASPARSVYEGMFDRAVATQMAQRDPLGLVRTLGGGASDPGLKIADPPADTVTGHHDHGGGSGQP
jgi:hypothetical protein